jgi:heme exporter protein C
MTLLFFTLVKYEMASKHATFRLRALRRKLAGDDDDDLMLTGRSAAPQL